MDERRKSTRLDLNLPARVETATGVHEGTIINCSVGGCFVQVQVEEPSDEPLKLAIQLPTGNVELWGSVAYYLPTMGFGLRFTSSSGEGNRMLNRWLNYLQTVRSSFRQGADSQSVTS